MELYWFLAKPQGTIIRISVIRIPSVMVVLVIRKSAQKRLANFTVRAFVFIHGSLVTLPSLM